MLKKGINILLIIAVIALFNSCDFKKEDKSTSFVFMNFNNYKEIYNLLNDSIKTYTDSSLATFLSEYYSAWKVDSMICLNSNKDKLFSVVLISSGIGKGMKGDNAQEILGKKIEGQWYFFHGGGTLTIPRDMYGKDEMHPLSFYELSQIARENMLESALIEKDGEYVVSDKWVEDRFYNGGYYTFGKHKDPLLVGPGEQFQMPRDKQKFDSVHWALIQSKWKEKIDTAQYKPRIKSKSQVSSPKS